MLFKAAFLTVFLISILVLFYSVSPTHAQQDDVETIGTELVQTGVTVLDKNGRFVEGLKKEDFELRVDGRPIELSFFESIFAGSYRDRRARPFGTGDATTSDAASRSGAPPRTIVFFLDDNHLSVSSISRTRQSLLDFINKEMRSDDLVAIASASGRIGFLQQFTDNKDVLRAAVARIGHVPNVASDYGGNPNAPMTEFLALTIERRDNPGVFDFFVQDCLRWSVKGFDPRQRGSIRQHCEVEVRNRARQIVIQAGSITEATYSSLEVLLRSMQRMPGSKLAFFFSDGFLADTGPRGRVASDRIRKLTDEARRGGVVIYSIDARGLVSGALDATGNVPFDASGGLLAGTVLRDVNTMQDGMNALAVDTGGRALRNQNYFDRFITDAVSETSRYYLLAWQPEEGAGRDEKFKSIEVKVAGRPDLTVRFGRSYFTADPTAATARPAGKKKEPVEKKPETEIREALADFYPNRTLPVTLSLSYIDTPANGAVLTTSVLIPAEDLLRQSNTTADVVLAGVVLDDKGKPAASFRTGLKVYPTRPAGRSDDSTVIYNYPSPLKPGIYQVRAAARDDKSGKLGSAMQWIVIPDLSTGELVLSSVLLAPETVAGKSHEIERTQWSIDHRVDRGSRLRFLAFVYNASRNAGAPELFARVEVRRDGREVMSTPFNKIKTEGQTDLARIVFPSEIDVRDLAPGRYELLLTVEDRGSNKTATQRTSFFVR